MHYSIATALPRIASDLHSGQESSWVATAYLLTRYVVPKSRTRVLLTACASLSFTPLYGRWSDVFGRKIVLLVSLFVFLVFSLACALAQTMIQVRCIDPQPKVLLLNLTPLVDYFPSFPRHWRWR